MLAKELGYVNVNSMLREISWEQFLEWEAYFELEPFGPERDDYRFASVVQALWNIARDPVKNPKGWPLDDFLVLFGDATRSEKIPQPVAYQETVIDSWVYINNAIVAAKAKREGN